MQTSIIKLTLIFLAIFPQLTALTQIPLSCYIFTIYYSSSYLVYKFWALPSLSLDFSYEPPHVHVKITK